MLTWRSKALALTSNFGIGFIPPAVEPGGDLCDFVETGIWRGGARIVLAGGIAFQHLTLFGAWPGPGMFLSS